MKERIDIIVGEKRLLENPQKIERLNRTSQLLPVDRIPVLIREGLWVPLGARGVQFKEYVASARDNMRQQILNHKWEEENMPDDTPIAINEIWVTPTFGALLGIEFPMDIRWNDNQPPKTIHMLYEPEQIDTLMVPAPNTGLCEVKIQWYKEMLALREEFDVRINGEHVEVRVDISHYGGPIPSAYALAGENMFIWMLTKPDRAHRLMEVVTESFCQVVEFFDDLAGRSHDHSLPMGADTAEMLSPKLFLEFVVPYYLKVWERYKGSRSFHMCGKIDHLLNILRDNLQITDLNYFGFPLEVKNLRDKLTGHVTMSGGPSPMLIYDGPIPVINKECMTYIKELGSKGGYTLSTGGSVMQGTKWEHIEAMINASKQVGFPEN